MCCPSTGEQIVTLRSAPVVGQPLWTVTVYDFENWPSASHAFTVIGCGPRKIPLEKSIVRTFFASKTFNDSMYTWIAATGSESVTAARIRSGLKIVASGPAEQTVTV